MSASMMSVTATWMCGLRQALPRSQKHELVCFHGHACLDQTLHHHLPCKLVHGATLFIAGIEVGVETSMIRTGSKRRCIFMASCSRSQQCDVTGPLSLDICTAPSGGLVLCNSKSFWLTSDALTLGTGPDRSWRLRWTTSKWM